MSRKRKTTRNKLLVKMVDKIGVVRAAKELRLAKSTVSELYKREKREFGLSTGRLAS